ncbi:MAG: hypothetical protein M3R24_06915 [Chloroflexota bacterium]|nr:hypothetical protein [Chloroflexota bacterium]
MSSALAMPAPGPATVRLALIRSGIELFGLGYTRGILFPIIRDISICIRPPERLTLSNQLLRAYKGQAGGAKSFDSLEESLVYREVAHAEGVLTVYLRVNLDREAAFRDLLNGIGYWGTASSFASCTGIVRASPNLAECAQPLSSISQHVRVDRLFACLVSEFIAAPVRWDDVMPERQSGRTQVLQLQVYIWPLAVKPQCGAGRVLERCVLI